MRLPKKRVCDSCSRRKIKCDGREPRCDYCEHHNLRCTFDLLRQRVELAKARKEAKYKKAVERLGAFGRTLPDEPKPESGVLISSGSHEAHPSLLTARRPPSPPSPLSPLVAAPTPEGHQSESSGKFHFAGYEIGSISPRYGLPLFSSNGRRWIESRTGQAAVFPALGLSDNYRPLYGDAAATILLPRPPLPSREAVEEHFASFCSSHIWLVFPVVDPVLFKRTIAAAYQPEGQLDASCQAEAKMCVLSFLCVASIFVPLPGLMPGAIESYPVQVQGWLPQMFVASSVHLLQICLMQSIYHLFSRHCHVGILFHSLACRMLFPLGAHRDGIDYLSPKPPHETEDSWRWKCYLRHCFWMLYVCDKDMALRFGQLPSIPDEHCDLALPAGYKSGLGRVWDYVGKPHLPGDLRLSVIKSKAVQHLHSQSATRKSNAELLRDIRELDDELEAWRLSVDPEIRPRLFHGMNDVVLSASPHVGRRMQSIITNFEYHHLVATIHQATGRCRSGAIHGNETLKGVSSSVALSVEASRSTLIFLATAGRQMASDAFWMMIFYPVKAIMSVFLNILSNPQDLQAADDLQLLQKTPDIIRTIQNPLTHNAHTHIDVIEGFVAEMVRLGTCAIERAGQTG